ncbi:Lin0512 family protein [Algicella marina]|uniref:Uncharacterized protein n=1 Tax=Algicella marina TaxID=2683284 RepID=A0A6P1SUA4_9RHOB|nr:Lin0512 family protein [Algicella marina]QHQ34018.1 hypothetical protein GO499_01865 [Algicella marina]
MSLQRIIIEMGTGNDLYGQDYTKAARRAVEDAMRHSSITLFWTLDVPPAAMQVKVTVAVQQPEQVDVAKVAEIMPHGQISVEVVKGGLDVVHAEGELHHVVATAAVEAYLPRTALAGWKAI